MNNKIVENCKIGDNTKIWSYVNLYDCEIGSNCIIGSFVEIQGGVRIGNFVKVESHSFICEGVIIDDKVLIGHHVVFVNDKYPRSTNKNGELKTKTDWDSQKTLIKKGASIGSNSTILGGITVGENAIIGAGSVVTRDIPDNCIAFGNPALVKRTLPPDFIDEN